MRQVPTLMNVSAASSASTVDTCSRNWPMAMKMPPDTIVRLAPRNRSAISPRRKREHVEREVVAREDRCGPSHVETQAAHAHQAVM